MIHSTEFPPGPGGIGTHSYQIAENLALRGWKVLVITPQDYIDGMEINIFNKKQKFSIIRLKHLPFFIFEAIYRLIVVRHWIKVWSPNIIIATGKQAVWIISILSIIFKKPWIAVGCGSEFKKTNLHRKYINQWSYGKANALVSISNYTSKIIKKMGINTNSLLVIQPGADENIFKQIDKEKIQNYKQSLGLKDSFIIMTVGNVTRRKGQDIIIRALPYILKKIPNVHYLLIGLPTRSAELKKLARKLDVSDRVHFKGRVNQIELNLAYNACDLFVITSRHTTDGDFEGYGIVVAEAALCGKPAVVSGGSGLEEVIIPNQTGMIVSENNPIETAQKIIQLLENTHMRLKMGECSRKRALKEQTWTSRVNIYEKLLNEIIMKTKCSSS